MQVAYAAESQRSMPTHGGTASMLTLGVSRKKTTAKNQTQKIN